MLNKHMYDRVMNIESKILGGWREEKWLLWHRKRTNVARMQNISGDELFQVMMAEQIAKESESS